MKNFLWNLFCKPFCLQKPEGVSGISFHKEGLIYRLAWYGSWTNDMRVHEDKFCPFARQVLIGILTIAAFSGFTSVILGTMAAPFICAFTSLTAELPVLILGVALDIIAIISIWSFCAFKKVEFVTKVNNVVGEGMEKANAKIDIKPSEWEFVVLIKNFYTSFHDKFCPSMTVYEKDSDT